MLSRGHLSSYFLGVAFKRLSLVEVSRTASHQHELNGVQSLRKVLGDARRKFVTRFVYLGTDDEDGVAEEGTSTWYDAREDHPTRQEYRLYFQENAAFKKAAEGDFLVVAKLKDGRLLILVTKQDTTSENQILWLFGVERTVARSARLRLASTETRELELVSEYLLETLGINLAPEVSKKTIDQLIERFRGGFPSTSDFSEYARETSSGVSATGNPDDAVTVWMQQEERLFRALERQVVRQRLRQGFGRTGDDVDSFVQFSLSVQNRRKARAGRALENHMEQVFIANKVRYSRGAVTENRSRPDFVFPHIDSYRDITFPSERLSVLGVKSSCKERWRQVLAEADRVATKHLLTLEPAISEAQTDEMRSRNLTLVVPKSIHSSYSPTQRTWLMDVRSFVDLIKTLDSVPGAQGRV